MDEKTTKEKMMSEQMDKMGYCPLFTYELSDDMCIEVFHNGKLVLRIDTLFIIESSVEGRSKCIKVIQSLIQHVNECDNSPWLRNWQNEKNEMLMEVLGK